MKVAANAIAHCDNCGSRFYQSRGDHRFCSITCHHEFHIAERRAAVEFFRRQRMSVRREEGKARLAQGMSK
jgi:hypothetical protein